MATMTLATTHADAAALAHERLVPLREWLRGHWAAVFSNPEDFAPDPSTPPGFVTCIAHEARLARIKPIAFARSLEPVSNWLDHAVNDDALVVLNHRNDIIDLAERCLATTLARLRQPFVVILDERGRARMTLNYRSGDRRRTMLDVVDMVELLRRGRVPSIRSRDAEIA